MFKPFYCCLVCFFAELRSAHRVRFTQPCKQFCVHLVSRMFWIFSKIQRSKPDLLFSEFSGFYILFNLQLSRISLRCQTCLLQRLFIITGCFSFVNNFFNLFFRFIWNDCCSLKREDYNSKPQTVCQQLFYFFNVFLFLEVQTIQTILKAPWNLRAPPVHDLLNHQCCF